MILPECMEGLALSQGIPVFMSVMPSSISPKQKKRKKKNK
jgi:hypothetical protein